jgi:FkbM family methyltransferase
MTLTMKYQYLSSPAKWLFAGFGFLVGITVSNFFRYTSTSTATATGMANHNSTKKRPLQVFPLFKEMNAGWGNMQVPPLLHKNAEGKRALIVDVGLDQGKEFFFSMDRGFELVGFEPNPMSFPRLHEQCNARPTCHVVDLATVARPLKREPGHSYLVNAAVGAEPASLPFLSSGAGSTLLPPSSKDSGQVQVPVVRIDDFIQEDVYLFKIDTQGFDHFVLKGAEKLFRNHVVRQIIFEVEPLAMSRSKLKISDTMEMVQGYGMACFTDRNDLEPKCKYYGDSVEGFEEKYFAKGNIAHPEAMWAPCWEDFMCINIDKGWNGPVLSPFIQ